MSDPMAFRHLNDLTDDGFVTMLSDVFEHSPWVAERIVDQRPYKSLRGLHGAMMQEVSDASEREQLTLIRAHPDLAGKAALAGDLTEASTEEQSGAGLDTLSSEEMERFTDLNERYQSKFGFPFIIAVRNHDKEAILAAFETRLENEMDEEQAEALRQIGEIARLRLDALLHHSDKADTPPDGEED